MLLKAVKNINLKKGFDSSKNICLHHDVMLMQEYASAFLLFFIRFFCM